MKRNPFTYISLLVLNSLIFSCSPVKEYFIPSPDGNVVLKVTLDRENGELSYEVSSNGKQIISKSRTGLSTSLGDFRSGLKLTGQTLKTVDETYTLPQGKVSTWHNHANECTFSLKKQKVAYGVVFRVYNDGVAFRYLLPGQGAAEFLEESSTVAVAGEQITCWGQKHPNRYGYESALGPVEADQISNPVLVHVPDKDHYLLIGQAATYGHYIQPHFTRSGSTFSYAYPLDQEKIGPVRSTLPFESPWRMIMISAGDPGKIVESQMPENLNPPTDPSLLNPDGSLKNWIRTGRVMWDYIAKDGDKPRMWIDATAEMGWEFYMADAGFVNRWGGPDSVSAVIPYADSKNVGVIGWAHTREFNTREKAAATMKQYAGWGLKGAKIDFFDHNTLSENPREWRDYEDTQQSLQMRDWIFELAMENNFLLELHGNTIPTGERRRYPNLMTLEGVDGMERRAKPAANDLTIPYVRNIMGPVSYTIIHFERCPGTHAYQAAMAVVYEAGLKIYAEHGHKLLEWPGRELISEVPAEWDETRFIEGIPASHIVMARRKGADWYIAGMTDAPRTVNLALDFLEEGKNYQALMFLDQTHETMERRLQSVSQTTALQLNLLERGGFAIQLKPSE